MFDFLKKHVRNRSVIQPIEPRCTRIPNLREVHSAGFVYPVRGSGFESELARIESIFRERNIGFTGLLVESRRGELDRRGAEAGHDGRTAAQRLQERGYAVLRRKSVNWAGVPRLQGLEPFFRNEYDLLVSFNAAGDFTSDYLVRRTKAKCVTGMRSAEGHPYTWVMEGPDRTVLPYADYLEQIFFYLEVINR